MIKKQAEANFPTDYGMFRMIAFSEREKDWMPHFALIAENTDLSKIVNVRFHSECITGEVFHSNKCECGPQLDYALEYMQKNGGIVVYLRQEGRNIGIINKLRAYELQEKGRDTVEANLDLGLPADARDFSVAVEILKQLGVSKINMLTNNPLKLEAVENSTVVLEKRIPLQIKPNIHSKGYLTVKKDYFGHMLEDDFES